MRDLLALPVRHGGLGLINPVSSTLSAHQASTQLTAPLVPDIVSQNQNKALDVFRILEIKANPTELGRNSKLRPLMIYSPHS
jgi:hypothetical protein